MEMDNNDADAHENNGCYVTDAGMMKNWRNNELLNRYHNSRMEIRN